MTFLIQIGLLVLTFGLLVFEGWCIWDSTKYLNQLKREQEDQEDRALIAASRNDEFRSLSSIRDEIKAGR